MSKQLVTSFDPTAKTADQFPIGFAGNHDPQTGTYGFLLIANESSVGLIFQIEADQFRLPPWTKDKVVLSAPTTLVMWKQEFTLSNNAGAPASQVYVDGFTWDEVVSNVYPLALMRNTNIGNTVATAVTNTLINDGSAANTVIIETTPVDQATSAFKLDNEGNFTLRTVDSGVWSVIFSIIEGAGGGAATKLFHGTSDLATTATTANAVAAANVTAGALPAGVTSPNYVAKSGDTMTSTLTITTPESGGSAQMIKLAPSDAATNWSINQEHSTQQLKFIDNTSGSVPILLSSVAGASSFTGVLTPQHGNGTFGIRGDFSGTGSGTVATGAGATPTICLTEDSQAGSSMTMGVVISGTNAIVTAGAAHTWLGLAA